jgi:hypothetical protein
VTEPASPLLCAPWATRDDLDEPPGTVPVVDPDRWDELLLIASEILWALSGRQWSGRSDPPCTATATLYADRQGLCWRGLGRAYAGAGFAALKLPHDEVTDVVSVTAGATAFTGYRRRGSWLVRTDGRAWSGDADVEIEYEWGNPPPVAGRRAAALYAVELAKAECGDSTCRIPKRVVSIVRQGVSMTLIDPQTYLDKGKLGIPDIDQWLMSVNPGALTERATFWSPDIPRATLG